MTAEDLKCGFFLCAMASDDEFLSMHVVRDNISIDAVYKECIRITEPQMQMSIPVVLHLRCLEIFPSIAIHYKLLVYLINRDLLGWEERILLHEVTTTVRGSCSIQLDGVKGIPTEWDFVHDKSLLFIVQVNGNSSDDVVCHWVVYPLTPTASLACQRLPLNPSKCLFDDILSVLHKPRKSSRPTSYITFSLDALTPNSDDNCGTISSTPIDDACLSLIPSRVTKIVDPEVFGYKSCIEVQFSPACDYLSLRTVDSVYVLETTNWKPVHSIHASEGFACSAGCQWVSATEILVSTSPHTTQLVDLTNNSVVIDDSLHNNWPVPCTTAVSADGRITAVGTLAGTVRFIRTTDDAAAAHTMLYESKVVLPVAVTCVVWARDWLAFCGEIDTRESNSLPVFILSVDEPKRAISRHLQDWSQKWIGSAQAGRGASSLKSRIFSTVVDQQLV